MINEKLLKEAAENLKEDIKHGYIDITSDFDDEKFGYLKTLLDLAEQFLKLEGFPEKKKIPNPKFNELTQENVNTINGFNEAIDLCKWAHLKIINSFKKSTMKHYIKKSELPSKGEIQDIIDNIYDVDDSISNWDILSQKLHDRITGVEK